MSRRRRARPPAARPRGAREGWEGAGRVVLRLPVVLLLAGPAAPGAATGEEAVPAEVVEWQGKVLHIRRHDAFAQSVATLFQPVSREAAIERKYREMGAWDIEILEIEPEPEGLRVRTRRRVPADVPRVLRPFLSGKRLTQTELWRSRGDERDASVAVEIEAAPVRVEGEVRMRPAPAGATMDMHFRVHCGVPLLGRRLAEFVGGITREILANEAAFLRSWQDVGPESRGGAASGSEEVGADRGVCPPPALDLEGTQHEVAGRAGVAEDVDVDAGDAELRCEEAR